MSAQAIRRLLFVAAILTVWGPPALRPAHRELDAALANPLALDPAAVLQVGAWAFADALVLLLLISHLARRTQFLSDLLAYRPVRWYGLYGLLALASMSYSVSPVYTAFFAHKIVIGVLVLALLEWHWPSRSGSRALQVLFLVYSLQAAAIAILYFARREWVIPFGSEADDTAVRVTGGVFGDYGSSALLSGVFFLTVALFGSRQIYRLAAWGAYAATWWLIVLSQTRSTMAAGVVLLIIMVHAHPRARGYGSLIAAGAGLVVVGLLPAAVQGLVAVGTREGEALDTLSGRTIAFSYLLDRWAESPLVGYGFGAGTRSLLVDFVAREGLEIGAGHDSLSTVLVDLGLIGLALLAACFIAAWLAFVRLYRAVAGREATVAAHQVACLLVWVTMQTVVSQSLASPYPVFIVAIIAMWTLQRRQAPLPVRAAAASAGR